MPPPGTNGGTSAAGWKSPPTSKTFKTPFISSRFSLSVSVPAFYFYQRKGNLSSSDLLSNTSAILVKYLHPWGPTTPATTRWGSLTFGWDASGHPIRGRILLQQEWGPSLSDSSKPWTRPPREPSQRHRRHAFLKLKERQQVGTDPRRKHHNHHLIHRSISSPIN